MAKAKKDAQNPASKTLLSVGFEIDILGGAKAVKADALTGDALAQAHDALKVAGRAALESVGATSEAAKQLKTSKEAREAAAWSVVVAGANLYKGLRAAGIADMQAFEAVASDLKIAGYSRNGQSEYSKGARAFAADVKRDAGESAKHYNARALPPPASKQYGKALASRSNVAGRARALAGACASLKTASERLAEGGAGKDLLDAVASLFKAAEKAASKADAEAKAEMATAKESGKAKKKAK